MLLVKIGTLSRCYCLPDTLNSLLILYTIIERARQLSKVSDALTHDKHLHVGCGCGHTHLFRGPLLLHITVVKWFR